MSITSMLKRLFRRRPTAYDLAKAQRDQEFAQVVAASAFFLIATPDVEGLPISEFTPEKLLEAAEKAAVKLRDREQFAPFCYENRGMTLLPFFTSQARAESFAGAYCGREEKLFQFPMRSADASVLSYWIGVNQEHSVILDPQSDEEIVLTPAQVALVVKVCPPADRALALSMDSGSGFDAEGNLQTGSQEQP